MTNHESIQRMTPEELAKFLDHVYLTGFNNGTYAAHLTDETQIDGTEKSPYDKDWLQAEAEDAVQHPIAEDQFLPAALEAAILRNTGISDVQEIELG